MTTAAAIIKVLATSFEFVVRLIILSAAFVKQEEKLGVINLKGKEIIKPEYETITSDNYYNEKTKNKTTGFIVSQKTESGYRYGYINYRGKMILHTEYTELERVTGIAKRKPQFILTSATLGDKDKDIEGIVNFAENLTSSKYSKEDIIFAKRISLEEGNIKYSVNPSDYSKILENYQNISIAKEIASKYTSFENCKDIKELLFELLEKDKNVYLLHNEIKSDTKRTFAEVMNNLNKKITISTKQLIDLIELITKANKNNRTLFDSKYHSFIRTLDGAFITIGKDKKMKLTNHKTIDGKKAFEIGLCKYCDQMYIMGKISQNELKQNDDVDIDENYGDMEEMKVNYFLLKENANIDERYNDNEHLDEYIVCSKCGNI